QVAARRDVEEPTDVGAFGGRAVRLNPVPEGETVIIAARIVMVSERSATKEHIMSTKNTSDDDATEVIRLDPEQMVEVTGGVPRRRRSKGNAKQVTETRPNKRSRQEFAMLINGAFQKRAETILRSIELTFEIANYLIDAKKELNRGEYRKLRDEDLEFSPSKARKLAIIGGNTILAKRSNWNALPSSWTTLY